MGCLCCCDLFLLPAVVATVVTDSEHMLVELELIKQIITGSAVTREREKTEVVRAITVATCKVEKATSGSNAAATVGITTPKIHGMCATVHNSTYSVCAARPESRVERSEATLLGCTRVVSQRSQSKDHNGRDSLQSSSRFAGTATQFVEN